MAIDYSQKIPNNVNLADDRTLQRALEQWQPNFINWWDDVGPEGSTNHDVYLRTATSVDPQGWAHFDYVKMRDYRWGIFLNPGRCRAQGPLRRPQGREGLAGRARRAPRQPAPDHRHAGRHRAGVGRAAAPSRPDRAFALRPAQPVPGQRRGRPPPLGDGLPAAEVLRPRRPRGGGRAARAHLGRREQPAHPRRLQREDAGLAGVLHVHLLHRPRRQVPARRPGRERLRSAGADDQVHADRGSAPHVRGRERRLARAAAHRAGDERAEDRRPGAGARGRRDRPAARSSATSTSTTR